MTKKITRLALASVLAAFTLGVVAQLPAQEEKEGKKAAGAAVVKEKKTRDTAPFHGKIEAVDMTAKTVKVGQRTFQVTSTTKIVRQGKPALLEEAKTGEAVGGFYKKTEDGRLELITLRIGPKPAKEAALEKAEKAEKPKKAEKKKARE